MNPNFKFSCGELDTINGYKLKASVPDERGFYTICVGCIGAPTQNSVIYDTESTIAAMGDPASRFNISLREGYLHGEWGHPVVDDPRDPAQMNRLLRIDEHYISHYFGKIWVDDANPVRLSSGENAYRIMAKVKPAGPFGKYLEQSLQDPHANTAFSVRCLCMPMSGPRKECQYRKVALMITFDAVHAPGFEVANKRYSQMAGTESWLEYDFIKPTINDAVAVAGLESGMMVTKDNVRKLYDEKEIYIGRKLVGIDTVGRSSIKTTSGKIVNAASLFYNSRRV